MDENTSGYIPASKPDGHSTTESAVDREKMLKTWNRAWKIELIGTSNPTWTDMYAEEVEAGMVFSAHQCYSSPLGIP